MEYNKITAAGKNLTTIGYTMIFGILISVIQFIVMTNVKITDIDTLSKISIVCTVLYIVLTINIISNLLSAGSNLSSFKDAEIAGGDIIGTPTTIENLQVAQYDFPEDMSWDDAKAACTKLGEGWRLPTKDELNLLYQNKNKIGGFASDYYWSSTEYNNGSAWRQYFSYGRQVYYYKASRYYVRAFCSL